MKERTEIAGASMVDGPPDETGVERKLRQLIVRSVESPDFKPPMLPKVAHELMKMANDPKTNFERVERILSSDHAMAAKIIKTANSAFFSRGVEIRSLKTAVARLGLARIRDIAFQIVSETRLFRVKEYQPAVTQELIHARGVGILARDVCAMVGVEKEMAFLCGLLHDVGKALAFGIVADWARKKKRPLPDTESLYFVLNRIHPGVGARVVESWELPPIICNSVRLHHDPYQNGVIHQMAGAVKAADLCSLHVGLGRPLSSISQDKLKVFFDLNLGEKQVDSLLERSMEVKEQLEAEVLG